MLHLQPDETDPRVSIGLEPNGRQQAGALLEGRHDGGMALSECLKLSDNQMTRQTAKL
jgi:hypothetical protein